MSRFGTHPISTVPYRYLSTLRNEHLCYSFLAPREIYGGNFDHMWLMYVPGKKMRFSVRLTFMV